MEGKLKTQHLALLATGSAVTASLLALYTRSSVLREAKQVQEYAVNQTRILEYEKLPSHVTWIDDDTFRVVVAICDAFIPGLRAGELSEQAIWEALDAIHPKIRESGLFDAGEFLKDKDRQTYLQRGALDLRVPITACELLQRALTKQEQSKIYVLLKILSTSLGCMLVTGYPVPFPVLSVKQRAIVLGQLRDSSIAPFRTFYQTVRRLTGNQYFGDIPEHGGSNVNWKQLAYDPVETVSKKKKVPDEGDHVDAQLRQRVTYEATCGALSPTSAAAAAATIAGEEVQEFDVDVVVVGSGSGGGMMAAELAKAGLRVLVLEKGGYYRSTDFAKWRESEAYAHTFEKGGLVGTEEGAVLVLAGSCVGGGSTVNWSASFRTPDFVLKDWAAQGMPQFNEGGVFSKSQDAVHSLISVNCDNAHRTASEEEAAVAQQQKDGIAPFAINRNNTLLWEASEKLGYTPEKIPRNVRSCVDCGHCCCGCPYDSKQSTLTALMEPLLLATGAQAGATQQQQQQQQSKHVYDLHIIPHCYVDKVLYETVDSTADITCTANIGGFPCRKRAIGVEATVTVMPAATAPLDGAEAVKQRLTRNLHPPAGTKKVRIRVKAKVVVSAAGALHTPALLQRSGLRGKGDLVGKHLTLHPVLGVGGVFKDGEDTRLASGVSMGVVVRNPPIAAPLSTGADVDLQYPVAAETPPLHAGLMGIMFPWSRIGGGLAVKLGMTMWRRSSTFIFISRDRSQRSNRVEIDSEGNPMLFYTIQEKKQGEEGDDLQMLLNGLITNMRFMRAAGASFVYTPHENFPWHYCGGDKVEEAERFEKYLEQVRSEGVKISSMQVFSAHQMSSCRMAADPAKGPTSPSGELFECANLFISDASVFPTSLGINPMVTIESFAHMISRNIIARLERDHPALKSKINAFRGASTACSSNQQW